MLLQGSEVLKSTLVNVDAKLTLHLPLMFFLQVRIHYDNTMFSEKLKIKLLKIPAIIRIVSKVLS
jgi:hypothetical protein